MTDLQLESLEKKKLYWLGKEVIVSGEKIVRGVTEPTMDEGTVIDVSLNLAKLQLTIELSDGRTVREPAAEVMIKTARRFSR